MVTKTENVRTDLVPTNGNRMITKIQPVELLDITGCIRDFTKNQKEGVEIALEKQVEALKDKGEAEAILDLRLHRLTGLEHEKLTFFYQGLDQKLTGVQEHHVIEKVLA